MNHRKKYLFILFFFCYVESGNLMAQSSLQKFDDRALEYLASGRTDGQTKTMLFISNSNTYVNIAIPAGLLAGGIISKDYNMRQNALYVATSTAATAVFNELIKKIVKRPRPFISNIHFTAVYQPGSYSFPSGHTSSAFSSATALSRAYPRWWVVAPSFLWAGAVGYRVCTWGCTTQPMSAPVPCWARVSQLRPDSSGHDMLMTVIHIIDIILLI